MPDPKIGYWRSAVARAILSIRFQQAAFTEQTFPSLFLPRHNAVYPAVSVLHAQRGEMLPYRDACFDKVYCSEVLEHVIDPDRIVAEMIRVLKPCGTLILSIPNEHLIDRIKSLIAMTGFYRQIFSSDGYESPRVNEWHLHRFDKKHLKRLVGDRLVWKRIRCIPFAILPFRLVAVLHKPK